MFKIFYILETQFRTVHYHTPAPGRWDVTGINGNVMLHSGFPYVKILLRKSFTVCTSAPGNIRHPSSRTKMFEEVGQIKVGTEAFAVTEFIRIQSHARPNGDIQSGFGYPLNAFGLYQSTSTPLRRGRGHSRNVDKPSHLDAADCPRKLHWM
jgi:hypothetical protein